MVFDECLGLAQENVGNDPVMPFITEVSAFRLRPRLPPTCLVSRKCPAAGPGREARAPPGAACPRVVLVAPPPKTAKGAPSGLKSKALER